MADPLDLQDEIKRLIEIGKKRGSLTYEEISDVLYQYEDVTPEQLDELFEKLTSEGIEIIDESGKEADKEATDDEVATTDGGMFDDPVRMYLREIGRVQLLTSEDEISLAQRIEQNEEAAKRA